MTKWEELYVKIDNFWDSIPAPFKVPLYQAFSAGILLAVDLATGKNITPDMWTAILMAFIANESAVIAEYFRKQSEKLELLKVQYNTEKLGR
jgi:hypothetical protein